MIFEFPILVFFFFFNDTATTEIYTLSLHDALPISARERHFQAAGDRPRDFVLNSEHIVEPAIVPVRPEVVSIRHVDQLGGDADAVAGFADTDRKSVV